MSKVGIDLGGTNIKAGIVNEENEIIAKGQKKTFAQRSAEEIMKDMEKLVEELLEEHHISKEQVEKVGIGCPGTIDSKTGTVIYSNNIVWENIELGAIMENSLQLPVKVYNDADCAALGETVAGAAKDCNNMILLTLGTGEGGGIILDGKVFDGYYAGGAELGHTTLIAGGEPCTCGRKGCLEAYASATAIIRIAKKKMEQEKESLLHEYNEIDGVAIFEAAKNNDRAANEAIDEYVMYLAEGIVNFVNIFRPEKVLLGGGISHAGDRLIQPVNEYVKKYCFGGNRTYIPEVMQLKLGNDAGIIGAANL